MSIIEDHLPPSQQKEITKIQKEKNNEKEKPKLKNSTVKKTSILGDSIIKNIDGSRLNRRINSIVSVRSFSGAITKAIKHHVMGCLKEGSPDTILFHHGTNDLKSEESAEKISSNIINVAVSTELKKRTVYVS